MKKENDDSWRSEEEINDIIRDLEQSLQNPNIKPEKAERIKDEIKQLEPLKHLNEGCYDTLQKKIDFATKKGSLLTFKKPIGVKGEWKGQILSIGGIEKDKGSGAIKIVGFTYDSPWYKNINELIDAMDWEKMEGWHSNNLNEWYDDDYYTKPTKVAFDVENMREVKDLFHSLAVDGIEDIKDHYPEWVTNILHEENNFIEERYQDYVWEFTDEAKKIIKTPEDLQRLLKTEGGFDKPVITKFEPDESAYLRGREPES